MANIARGEAECYISIEAECRVLYFQSSTQPRGLRRPPSILKITPPPSILKLLIAPLAQKSG